MPIIQDGVIIINKPKGCTSHDIVAKVKKLTGKKVGHTGTLDPLAQGVLPILIGKGTLCSKYLINHDKTYRVVLQLGKATETWDEEENVTEQQEVPDNIFQKDFVTAKLKTFEGKQKQIPPMYSAIKVNGKKLYDYARSGKTVEIEPREIEIYGIELCKIDEHAQTMEFEVKCSKGTYIRSLCVDIAHKLGTIGYMKELFRLQVGDFGIENSVTLKSAYRSRTDNIGKNNENENKVENENFDIMQIVQNVISVEQLFENYPKVEVEEKRIQHFLNGVKITVNKPDGVYRVYSQEKFVGVGIVANNLLKRDIIL